CAGEYVCPAVDTKINIAVPDIEPCWRGPRARTLVAGELSSAAYQNSPFPAASDLAVYSALISGLDLRDSTVIEPETWRWCAGFFGCPTLNVAHLERA